MSDPAINIPGLESLVRPLLDVLETVLGLESSYLTEVDNEVGVQHVVLARNSDCLQISEGLNAPWDDTLCKRAIESAVTAVGDVPDRWGDSAAAKELGIVTYVSAPVWVGGRLFGTLCAASRSCRPVSGAGERVVRTCADIIARHIERELAQQQRYSQASVALRDTQADLLHETRRLNAVLDNATVSIFLMDEQQHCVYMNTAAERLTGYTTAETAGRPLHNVVHHTHPDGTPYPLADCPIDRALQRTISNKARKSLSTGTGASTRWLTPQARSEMPTRESSALSLRCKTFASRRPCSMRSTRLTAPRTSSLQCWAMSCATRCHRSLR
jgi:PAS domain-containing protein